MRDFFVWQYDDLVSEDGVVMLYLVVTHFTAKNVRTFAINWCSSLMMDMCSLCKGKYVRAFPMHWCSSLMMDKYV